MAESTESPNAAEGWRASTLLGRAVVHLERVEHIGEVADVVFDTQQRRVVGILIGPKGAEGPVMDALRRMVGGTFGLTYVAAEDIVALNGDVVMIQPRPARRHGSGRLPSLRSTQGLSVVTMYGRRLGHFADLLLDDEGRAITGYLLDAPARPQPRQGAPAPNEDTKRSEPLIIPATAYLRVGRDLIALSERPLPADATPPDEDGAYSPDAPTEELRGR